MLTKVLFIGASCACLLSYAPPILAASLTAQLFPLTGEVRLKNPGVAPVQFISYSISSPSGKLNGSSGAWRSIADFYDASGSGFIDPVQEWTKLTPSAGAGATNLAEGVFVGPGGTLPGQRSVSLGRIWNPIPYPFIDLLFDIREPNEQLISVGIDFTIDGDYAGGESVNIADYAKWRQDFGSSLILFADGNIDGAVNAADYVVWRKNLGKTLLGGASGAAVASLSAIAVVPEPGTMSLILAASAALGLAISTWRRRRT